MKSQRKSKQSTTGRRRTGSGRRTFLAVIGCGLVLFATATLLAVDVNNQTELFDALLNAPDGETINILSNITLTAAPPEMDRNVTLTIEGNGNTLSGDGLYQILKITSGTVTIQNITLADGLAEGGVGGSGNGGGGGGLGAGGALYVGTGNDTGDANVTLDNVIFQGNTAHGGTGGVGTGTGTNGGNGGFYNANANSSNATYGGTTGFQGGVGTSGNGANAQSNTNNDPNGAEYGGGGPGSGITGTTGGTGNGGGTGGAKGFGGQGGGALGGAVFVSNGSTLTIKGTTGIASDNISTGGSGGTGSSGSGSTGFANGGGLYVGIGSTANLDTTSNDITITGAVYSNGNLAVDGNAAGNVNLRGGTIVTDNGSVTLSSGTLNLNSTQTNVFNGAITGGGGLNLVGTGTTYLNAANDYTGGTTVNTGAILQGNTEGLQGSITNSNVVRFLNVDVDGFFFDGTFNGMISGTGDVVVTGSTLVTTTTHPGTGIVTFTTAQSYTGDTTVNAGRLQGNAESLAQAISLTNNGEVIFNQSVGSSSTDTYTGVISGSGGVTFTGGTVVEFSQAQAYTGNTTFNLTGGANITTTQTAQYPGPLVNNTVLTYSQNTSGSYAGNMSGTGALVVNMTGTLLLSGTNSYAGGTTVAAGTLEGNTASIRGNIVNEDVVIFNQTTTGTYSGSMSGGGGVKLINSGRVIFTGTNSYTGGTTVEAGTLQGNTFSLQGYFDNGAEIDFRQNFTGTFSGTIDGAGSLVKSGTGNLILTGTQTYSGDTTIEAGRLSVNGTLDGTSVVYIQQDGILGGTGTILADVINDGTIAPGNSIGTMTVANFTSNSGSIHEVEINNAGTTPGVNNDLLIINNDVTLNGGTVSILTTTSVGFTAGSRYIFAEYGGNLSGTFDGATINTPFLTPTLDDSVSGELAFYLYRSATDYAAVAQTYNQYQVANYLDQNSQSASGDFATVLDQVNLLTASQAQTAFDEMTGAVYGTAASLNVQAATYLYLLLQRNSNFEGEFGSPRDADGNPLGYARSGLDPMDVVPVRRSSAADGTVLPVFRFVDRRGPVWNAWTTGYGSLDTGDPNKSNLGHYAAAGNVTSLYRYLNEVVKYGVFGTYNYVSVPTVTPQQSNVTNDSQFGSYLRVDDGRRHCLVGHSVGFDSFASSRLVQFGTINRTARGSYDGWQTTAYGEFGERIAEYPFDVEPFFGMQYSYLRQNAFQETGADSLNLNVNGIDTNALRQLIGARLIQDFLFGSLELRGVWIHEYLNPTTSLNTTFVGVGGANFSTQGTDLGRDNWLVGLGGNWNVTERLSLAADYDGFITNEQMFHVGSGSIQYRW